MGLWSHNLFVNQDPFHAEYFGPLLYLDHDRSSFCKSFDDDFDTPLSSFCKFPERFVRRMFLLTPSLQSNISMVKELDPERPSLGEIMSIIAQDQTKDDDFELWSSLHTRKTDDRMLG